MVDTPCGSSPTSPSARRSSGVNAVPRLSIGVPRTENPRARTRSTGPSSMVRHSNGRSLMTHCLRGAPPGPGPTPAAPAQPAPCRAGPRGARRATVGRTPPAPPPPQVPPPGPHHRELVDDLAVDQLTGRPDLPGQPGQGAVQRLLVLLAHLDGDRLLLRPDEFGDGPGGVRGD